MGEGMGGKEKRKMTNHLPFSFKYSEIKNRKQRGNCGELPLRD